MPFPARRTLIVAVAAAAIACGSVYSEEATPPGETADGGNDASVDAATAVVDSSPPVLVADAAPEASTRYCGNVGTQLGTNIFCADFDGPDFREGFTGSSDAGISTTTTTAQSAPNAFLAKAPFGTTFAARGPSLWWDNLGAPISSLDVTVGVNQEVPVGPPGAGNTGSVDLITMKTEMTTTTFQFSRENPSWSVVIEYAGGAAYAKRDEVTIPLVAGKWAKVNLAYNFRTGTVTVAYDGITVFNKPAHYTPASTLLDSKATIRIGAVARGKTDFENFRFDNLVARVTRE